MSRDDLAAHDDIQARIWGDERGLPPGTREVALAMAWVLYREHQPGGRPYWLRVKELLGYNGFRWRLHELVAGDRPRYDHGQWSAGPGECEGPRLRPYKPRSPAYPNLDRCLVSDHHPHLGECRYTIIHDLRGGYEPTEPVRDNTVCGAHGTIHVTERDMVTGWETVHWFCRRHAERASEVKTQLAARGKPPEPIPNRGGLLPRYFAGDWAAIYRKRCESAHEHWETPYYGVDADDWPVPGRTLIPKRPRLAVVAS